VDVAAGVGFGLVVVGFAVFPLVVVAGVAAGAVLVCLGFDLDCLDLDFAMVEVDVSLFVVVGGGGGGGDLVSVLAVSLMLLMVLGLVLGPGSLLPLFLLFFVDCLPHVDAGVWTDDPPGTNALAPEFNFLLSFTMLCY